MEEESLSKQGEGTGTTRSGLQDQQQLKLHELRPETYNGMVRLIKPGCRTIVMLVDNESRKKLVLKFHKTVWPYRKWVTPQNLVSFSCFDWKVLLPVRPPAIKFDQKLFLENENVY